ncbi:MAG: polysaccharide deacetylase, partial [Dehalococcoidia bacterium]
CVVNLGFDIDGKSGWILRDGSFADRPGTMTLGEYGPKVGLPRILDLLGEYDIKASFYVPGYEAETHPDIIPHLLARGHEVGHHGYIHEGPAELNEEEEREVLEKGIGILQEQMGEKPKGYRAPSWDVSTRTVSLLAEYGFLYDSSLMDDDVPYILQTEKGRLVEMPVQWQLDDFPFYGYNSAAGVRGPNCSPVSVARTWIAEFDGLYQEGRCFILTMHPQLTGHPSRLSGLERTIRHIRSRPGVKFMRLDELARYWLDRGLP